MYPSCTSRVSFLLVLIPIISHAQTIHFPLIEDFNAVGGNEILIPLSNDSGDTGSFATVTVPGSSCSNTSTTGAYTFVDNAGLSFQNNGFINGAFSLEMTFKIDELTIRSGRTVDWVNLVSFNQDQSDQGIYVRIGTEGTGRLQFWDSNTSQRNITTDIFNETDVFHLVLTRSASGLFTIYLNGIAAEVNYDDSAGNYQPNATDDAIYLFKDFPLADIVSITQKLDDEASPGWVKGLNITNSTWSQQEVTTRWESVCERLIDVQFVATNTCFLDETQFAIQNSLDNADSISWDFGDAGSGNNSGSGLTTSHVFSSTGNFNVISTVYYDGVPTPFAQMITIHDLPVVDLGPDRTLNVGESVLLDASNPGATFLWQDNSDAQTLEINAPGSYSVQVTDINGCVASDTITFTGAEIMPVEVPNVFTPNGDGENDLWVIENLEFYPDHNLQLFDRQGNLVRQWEPYNNDWDGTARTTTEAFGTYFFVLSANQGVLKKGSVSIVR